MSSYSLFYTESSALFILLHFTQQYIHSISNKSNHLHSCFLALCEYSILYPPNSYVYIFR